MTHFTRTRRAALFLTCALCALFLEGCTQRQRYSIEREDLWTFRIGRLEDQLDLYNLQSERSGQRTSLTMRDGLFYIANGAGGKILRYNSYGDILFMIYNEETNPAPITLKPKTGSAGATRWSIAWPLQEPGAVTVDSQKNMYVADKLPQARQVYDAEEKVLLNYSVLRFDIDGNFSEYLGQEGPGGRPFPFIDNIYISHDDELAVVCRLPRGMVVYWFGSDGRLLYTAKIRNDTLPMPQARDGLKAVLNGIAVAPDTRNLFLKIDYYREIHDQTTQTISGMEPDGAVLWTMDAASGEFRASVDIPFYERVITVNNRRGTENLLYSMFGAMNGSLVFLYIPVEAGFSLLILDAESGQERAHGFIRVENAELQFFAFDVSADGILSAILASQYEAKLVWWRTDRLLK